MYFGLFTFLKFYNNCNVNMHIINILRKFKILVNKENMMMSVDS